MRHLDIDTLVDIVREGGAFRTGVDVFNDRGLLVIEKDVLVNRVQTLLLIKRSGVRSVPVMLDGEGGIWDSSGRPLEPAAEEKTPGARRRAVRPRPPRSEVGRRIAEIAEIKEKARRVHSRARKNLKRVMEDIRRYNGEFDTALAEKVVDDIFDFVTRHDNAFSFLAREIIRYDDYLYNHSINVCAIATSVVKRFNEVFSAAVNDHLATRPEARISGAAGTSFMEYLPGDLRHLSLGYFLHDVGKTLIPDHILNKKGPLTPEEFEVVKTHSFDKGVRILEANRLDNLYAVKIARYHHAALYDGEERCYPGDLPPLEIPIYVKICKLADIYDAMTSKRCYKDAMNPTGVVTNIFRKYADRDHLLQFILHSFVKVVGIYPPGSVIYLVNGQMAYVLDSDGPLVIPFTTPEGDPLKRPVDPVDLSGRRPGESGMAVDRRRPLVSPIEVRDNLPEFLKKYQ